MHVYIYIYNILDLEDKVHSIWDSWSSNYLKNARKLFIFIYFLFVLKSSGVDDKFLLG